MLRIGKLAQLSGKSVRALHLYEEMGLLSPADRSPGGFRLYDDSNVARIAYIERLQRMDCSLSEIRSLVKAWQGEDSPREAMASLEFRYRAQLSEVREHIASLKALEGDLRQSLNFLEGCRSCGKVIEPQMACSCCERPEMGTGVPLISGLAGR